MSYRVTSPGWSGGSGLASSTACVLLLPSVLAALNKQNPGWKSASASGSVFTFDGASQSVAAGADHTIVTTISTGGTLGTMQFTYTINGGAPQGPIASAPTLPDGPLNQFLFFYAVPGTNTTLVFQGGGPSPAPLTNYPINATFTIPAGGAAATATGIGSAAPWSYLAYVNTATATNTLSLDTLNSTVAGDLVLIQTGIGLGWTQGVVASDGVSVVVPGLSTPTLPVATRAVAGLVAGGYAVVAGGDASTYVIAGRSGDGLKIWWAPSGSLAQFYTSSSLSTLGAVSGLCLVEVLANNPADDKGQWRVMLV